MKHAKEEKLKFDRYMRNLRKERERVCREMRERFKLPHRYEELYYNSKK